MSAMTCRSCGAETSNGLALCELCQRKASTDLEFLPVYFRNLARWRRPARPNGSLGTQGQWLIRKGDEGDANRIGRALDQANNDLVGWARMLADDRGIEPPGGFDTEAMQVTALSAWLAENLTSIATLEWCGEFMGGAWSAEHERGGIGLHEQRLRALTETSMPGWYAGACRRVTGKTMEGDQVTCGHPTYVIPGLTWVTCGGCGVATYARDHLEAVLDEARGWVAPPKRIAEAIVALVDTEQSVPRLYERIKKWEQREQLAGIQRSTRGYDWDEVQRRFVVVDQLVGSKRYRLGDVLDRVLAEGATRPSDVQPKATAAS